MAQSLEVVFHGATLLVTEHNQQPYVPMKPVVSGMGLAWQSQLAKLAGNAKRWGITEIVIPTASGEQGMSCLPLRKLPGWMATISPNKVRPELREKVIAFQNEADDVLWAAWQKQQPALPYSVQPGDVLPKAEADELRAMLETAAQKLPKEKRGAFLQGGWAKLKAHTGVNYRQIPKASVTDALSLLARHVAEWELVEDNTPKAGTVNETVADLVKKIESPNGYPAVLFTPIVEAVQRKMGNQPAQPDAARTKAAFDAASQAAASVQSAVFNAVLSGNDEWKYSRWMLAFIDDSAKGSPAYVRQMDRDAFVTTWPRLVRDVGTGECMCTTAELLDMAYACMQRLAQRGATAKLAA